MGKHEENEGEVAYCLTYKTESNARKKKKGNLMAAELGPNLCIKLVSLDNLEEMWSNLDNVLFLLYLFIIKLWSKRK